MEYFYNDPDTEIIMIYLEELRRARDFIDVAKKITSGNNPKPILVIKSGRTAAGAKAAASHTGAIAGSDAVYSAIFEQTGIIRAETINELFDFATAFTYKSETPLGKVRTKVPAGNRVAIITNAGGPGIVATDVTVTTGLVLADFTDETKEKLKQYLPSTANIHDPVDVIGDATSDRYENALRVVISDPNVDGALVILTPQSMTDAKATAEAIVRVASTTNKPIVSCFMGVVDVSLGVHYLQEHGYPVFSFPENGAKALGALYKFNSWLNREIYEDIKIEFDKKKVDEINRYSIEELKQAYKDLKKNSDEHNDTWYNFIEKKITTISNIRGQILKKSLENLRGGAF